MKTNIKIIIGVIVAVLISVSSCYVLADSIIDSKSVYYKDNSGLAVNNVQDAIDGTCTKFSKQIDTFLDKIYPIGSIYISATLSTVEQVKTALGGTWEVYGKGQTLVGIDTSQTEFNTIGKTGGAKSVSYTPGGTIGSTGLTISQIPSHSHTYDKVNANTGSHVLTVAEMPSHSGHVQRWGGDGYWYLNKKAGQQAESTLAPNRGWTVTEGNELYPAYTSYGGNQGHTHPISTTSTSTGAAGKGTTSDGHTHSFTGTAASISTLQPYVTVYMYKRTA